MAHYEGLGRYLAQLIQSKDAQERQLGLGLTRIEYENLYGALGRALRRRVGFWGMFDALFYLLYTQSAHRDAAALCAEVLAARARYSAGQLAGEIGVMFYLVFERLATANLNLKEYDRAEKAYKEALEVIAGLEAVEEKTRANYTANVNHQLGIVAQEQRQWAAAEGYYQQALALFVEFNDRYSQAKTLHALGVVYQGQRQFTEAESCYKQALERYIEFGDRFWQAGAYHQLGMVAQKQRQWAAAEEYYRQALALFVEFNDRYSQASTLHQLGMVAQEQRQWAAAEGYYRQALAIQVAFNDRYSQAGTLHQLGNVAEETDQLPAAIDYYLRAAETYVQFEDMHNLSIVIGSLARVWQSSGDATLPGRVAAVLGASEAEVVELFGRAGDQ